VKEYEEIAKSPEKTGGVFTNRSERNCGAKGLHRSWAKST